MSELFELYKSKDREIDMLAMSLQMATKEREIVEQRRDQAFSQLVDLLAERRRVLGVVQDRADLMSMRYIASRAKEQEMRFQS